MTDITPKHYVIEAELMERIFEAVERGKDSVVAQRDDYIYKNQGTPSNILQKHALTVYEKDITEFDSIIDQLKNGYGMGK